jgi:histidinol-phosphatase (PHP family)
MPLYDQHLHTFCSFDSKADPEENVLAAIDKGLAGLTFTDHFDTHPTEWPGCRYDYDKLRDIVAVLRDRYGSRIFLGLGIEICYQPERMDFILEYLESHTFDVVLLSVHWFDGKALHVREHWDGLVPEAGTRAYLETVLRAARQAGDLKRASGRRVFDILGHLDLVKRYTQRYFQSFDVRPHASLVDEVLHAAIEANLTLEINTSGLRQGVGEPMPAEWVVQRYAALGVREMALGSDAHIPKHIAADFDETVMTLRRSGIDAQAVFKNREREIVPLI